MDQITDFNLRPGFEAGAGIAIGVGFVRLFFSETKSIVIHVIRLWAEPTSLKLIVEFISVWLLSM